MAPTKTRKRPGPKVKWNHEMKMCVHLLYDEFDEPPNRRAEAFSSVFKEHLQICGLEEVTPAIINAQWGEHKKPTNQEWKSICAMLPKDDEIREALRLKIQAALTPKPYITSRAVPVFQMNQSRRVVAKRTVTKTSVQVLQEPPSTPQRTRSTTQLRTPTTSPKSLQHSSPKTLQVQRSGKPMMVSEKNAKKIATRYQSVLQRDAQPPLPGLLFRYWSKDPEDPTSGRDSEEGFWCRKYYNCNLVPHEPPTSSAVDPVDIFNHLNKEKEKTPYISTSSRLLWEMQQVIKRLQAGDEESRLTVIDPSKLDRRTIFHARPFHRELKKLYPFTGGAQYYAGTYEYLIWKEIPREAIVHTFKAKDLLDFVTRSEITTALRLDVLRSSGALGDKAKVLKNQQVALSPAVAASLAELCNFFGLNAHSGPKCLSHIVTDVIEGWGLQVEYREEEQWGELATVFANKLCQLSRQPVGFKKEVRAIMAFLGGVAWGCGDVNAAHTTKGIAKKERKAQGVGLRDPFKIITNAMDGIKLATISYKNAQARGLNEYHRQPLLQQGLVVGELDDEDEVTQDFGDDYEDDDPMVGSSTAKRSSFEYDQEVMYDDDDDEYFP